MLQGVFGTVFALGVVAFAVLLRVLPNTSGVSREALEAKLARAPVGLSSIAAVVTASRRENRPKPNPYLLDSFRRLSSVFGSKSASGQSSSRPRSVSSSSPFTNSRENHLRSAGTIHQGASGVEVRWIAIS